MPSTPGPLESPKPSRPSTPLEAWLGGKLFLVVGSLALALAGVFLVKHSFEKGWIGPPVRVALGIVFGAALLIVSDRIRKSNLEIASGAAAAGVAALYASFLAGVNLYGLLAPGLGFLMLAMTTAVAVLMSLRLSGLVAVLGLIGGFLTPMLLHTETVRPGGLTLYLLMLEGGLLWVVKKKNRWYLAVLTLTAATLWAMAWVFLFFSESQAPWIGAFVLASSVLLVLVPATAELSTPGRSRLFRGLTWAGALAGLFVLASLVQVGSFTTMEWGYLGILSTGVLVLARLKERDRVLALAAVGVPAWMLLSWIRQSSGAATPFIYTTWAFGLLFVLFPFGLRVRSSSPATWAVISAAAGPVYFSIAYAFAHRFYPPWTWAGLILALGLLNLGFAAATRSHRSSLAAYAVGVTICISYAVPILQHREWWTLAWALEIPALAQLERRFRLPALRTLGGILSLGVLIRLVFNPYVSLYDTGPGRVLNWLLYGYGVPIAALILTDRLLAGSGKSAWIRVHRWTAVLLGWAYLLREIFQYFHPGVKFLSTDLALHETGWMLTGGLLFALVLAWTAHRAWENPLGQASQFIAAAHLLMSAGILGFATNPLWQRVNVGVRPLWNRLIPSYAFVGAGLLLFGLITASRHPRTSRVFSAFGFFFLFFWVTLEVRHFFHGPYLNTGRANFQENSMYSLVWLLYGLVVMAIGIQRKTPVPRYTSLLIILLTVGKVFLFDTANLKGLYRVFSFFGLGVSLLLVAWVYQRFIFRRASS